MTWSLGFFTFINVWWIALFITLPVSVRTPTPTDSEPTPLPHVASWKKLFLANTVLSICITLLLALLIHVGIVPLKNLG